jgi:hypothetical protein
MIYSFAVKTMTRFLLVGLIAASLIASCFAQSSADRVFRNGKIYTVDARGTIAQAIAIRDGRIVYVGTNDKLAPFIGASTKVTDLHGRFLMPGLIDGGAGSRRRGIQQSVTPPYPINLLRAVRASTTCGKRVLEPSKCDRKDWYSSMACWLLPAASYTWPK